MPIAVNSSNYNKGYKNNTNNTTYANCKACILGNNLINCNNYNTCNDYKHNIDCTNWNIRITTTIETLVITIIVVTTVTLAILLTTPQTVLSVTHY